MALEDKKRNGERRAFLFSPARKEYMGMAEISADTPYFYMLRSYL